jgi:hypothetical protein
LRRSTAGMTLPASSNYTWAIIGVAPVASVDLAAAPGGINHLVLGDLTESDTARRTFTTAP